MLFWVCKFLLPPSQLHLLEQCSQWRVLYRLIYLTEKPFILLLLFTNRNHACFNSELSLKAVTLTVSPETSQKTKWSVKGNTCVLSWSTGWNHSRLTLCSFRITSVRNLFGRHQLVVRQSALVRPTVTIKRWSKENYGICMTSFNEIL